MLSKSENATLLIKFVATGNTMIYFDLDIIILVVEDIQQENVRILLNLIFFVAE